MVIFLFVWGLWMRGIWCFWIFFVRGFLFKVLLGDIDLVNLVRIYFLYDIIFILVVFVILKVKKNNFEVGEKNY